MCVFLHFVNPVIFLIHGIWGCLTFDFGFWDVGSWNVDFCILGLTLPHLTLPYNDIPADFTIPDPTLPYVPYLTLFCSTLSHKAIQWCLVHEPPPLVQTEIPNVLQKTRVARGALLFLLGHAWLF